MKEEKAMMRMLRLKGGECEGKQQLTEFCGRPSIKQFPISYIFHKKLNNSYMYIFRLSRGTRTREVPAWALYRQLRPLVP